MNDVKWCDMKPITPPKGEAPIRDICFYKKLLVMRDELIDEQQIELGKLKAKVNQLQLKLKAKQ